MFNADDYNDNVEYCRYVYEKNLELNLGLVSPAMIQFVTNRYLNKARAIGVLNDELYDEVYDNEKLLADLVEELRPMFKRLKLVSNEVDEEDEVETREIDDYKERTKLEKKFNSRGGHSYSESYDDVDINEINVRSR